MDDEEADAQSIGNGKHQAAALAFNKDFNENRGHQGKTPAMRALIVDDNATSLMLLKRVVCNIDNCSVVGFHDPYAAMGEIRAGGVDILLVDYMMPELDGIEFITQVRALPGRHELPIVFVTTPEEKSARVAALEAGATDFLTKPIDPAEVKARIRTIMRLRDAETKLADQAAWLADEVE